MSSSSSSSSSVAASASAPMFPISSLASASSSAKYQGATATAIAPYDKQTLKNILHILVKYQEESHEIKFTCEQIKEEIANAEIISRDRLKFLNGRIAHILQEMITKYGNLQSKKPLIDDIENVAKQMEALTEKLYLAENTIPDQQLKKEKEILEDQTRLDKSESFNNFLKFIAPILNQYPSPVIFFTHAWPFQNDPFQDAWTEDFMITLCEHLQKAGCRIYLDKVNNRNDCSLNVFMREGIAESNYILAIVNRTIDYKFSKMGVIGVAYEHACYYRKYRECQERGKTPPKIIPISFCKEAMPPGISALFHCFNAFEDSSYLSLLYHLLNVLYTLSDQHKILIRTEIDKLKRENSPPISLSTKKIGTLFSREEYEAQNRTVLSITENTTDESIQLNRNIVNNLSNHQIDRHFKGREAYLKMLHEQLSQYSVVCIPGSGGIGKSSVAKKLAHDHLKQYDIIWWFDAQADVEKKYEELGKLIAGYHEKFLWSEIKDDLDILSRIINSPDENNRAKPKEIAQITKSILAKYPGNWLLIFDDVIDEASLKNDLPMSGDKRHHVMATSRAMIWKNYFRTATLPMLDMFDAIAVLNSIFSNNQTTIQDSVPIDWLNALADVLNRHPLALRLAGHYLVRSALANNGLISEATIRDYIRALAETTAIWNQHLNEASQEMAIIPSWSLTIQQVQNISPEAVMLLEYMAFLNSAAIPKNLLVRLLPQSSSLDTTLTILASYSLITLNGDWIDIHPLIQAVVRRKVETEAHTKDRVQTTMKAILRYIEKDFDKSTRESYDLLRGTIPHMQKVWGCLKETKENLPEKTYQDKALYVLFLFITTELVTHTANDNQEATKKYMGEAIEQMKEFKNQNGKSDPVIELLGLLISIAYSTLIPEGAENTDPNLQFLQQVKTENLNSILDRLIGTTLHEIEGQVFLEAMVPILKDLLGEDHSWVFCLLLAQGAVYLGQGYLQKGAEIIVANISKLEAKFDPDNPVVRNLNQLKDWLNHPYLLWPIEMTLVALGFLRLNMQSLLRAQLVPLDQIFGKAYDWSRENDPEKKLILAIACVEKIWRPDHIHVARARVKLAAVYANKGCLEKQTEQLEKALIIFEKHFGSNNKAVLEIKQKLGGTTASSSASSASASSAALRLS